MSAVVIYAFRSPGSGAVYVGKHECDPTDWPRRGNGRLPDGYPGKGRVVDRFHRRHGAAVQWRILAVVSVSDWVQAERRAIHLARLICGRRCVNQSSGGDGFTSADSLALWADPKVKAKRRDTEATPAVKERRSAAMKAVHARPDVRARRAAAAARPDTKEKRSIAAKEVHAREDVKARHRQGTKDALARPEVRAKLSAASKEVMARPEVRARMAATNARPEVKARRSAATKEALNRPEVRAKLGDAMRRSWQRRRATKALAPFRRAPALHRPGLTVWHAPCGSPLGMAGPSQR